MQILNKLFLYFLMLLFPCSSLWAQDDNIKMYYKDQIVGEMKFLEFQELVKAAKAYSDELASENNKRVKIQIKENSYNIIVGETFESDINIIWFDEKGNAIKELVLENKIKIKKEDLSKYRVLYRDVSEWCAPISSSILLIILIIILL